MRHSYTIRKRVNVSRSIAPSLSGKRLKRILVSKRSLSPLRLSVSETSNGRQSSSPSPGKGMAGLFMMARLSSWKPLIQHRCQRIHCFMLFRTVSLSKPLPAHVLLNQQKQPCTSEKVKSPSSLKRGPFVPPTVKGYIDREAISATVPLAKVYSLSTRRLVPVLSAVDSGALLKLMIDSSSLTIP